MPSNVMQMIKDQEVKFVDLRFTDTRGKEQHVTLPATVIDDDFFTEGKMFDGSSISGWKGIQESDMVLMPEADTAVMDPFSDENQLITSHRNLGKRERGSVGRDNTRRTRRTGSRVATCKYRVCA